MLHDRICRMCKQNLHTDVHILLECTAHPTVVELRRTRLINGFADDDDPELYSMWHRQSFDELFNKIMARRDAIHRMSISLLVMDIEEIYDALPPCSELVLADRENPVARLFANEQ